jgi:uncharacterized protein YycO
MSYRWLVVPVAVFAYALLPAACSRSLVIRRPSDPAVDQAYTQIWVDEVSHHAEDGDLVLRRGYAVLSDVIIAVTPGDAISHAAIYDARTRSVIEAVDPVVREQSLESFVRGAHRVVIIRPTGLSPGERRAAVERARAALGTGFDHRGFVGWDDDKKFYCSEFVVWAIGARERGLPVDRLVVPGLLGQYGETVFDSGPRDESPRLARH